MTSFTATGTLADAKRSVTWDDGTITGDEILTTFLANWAKELEGVPQTTLSFTTSTFNHLKNAHMVYTWLCMAMPDVEITGEFPVMPPPPSGAIV
jgi:hypothetical protein